ncbi:hypothetical protein PVAND_015913 [Polypedilum vanderplanki]|uniref:Uncharacterized protein n=1 Tax=Polypedilum vanderplanki TaxID=319348 RepID=A0A9J6BE22_POLVA|nr:hypothetical protein PVAND_015913 [Polypedilum vanderplanki]
MKMLKYFLLLFVLHYAKGIPIYCSFQTVSLSDSATLYYCEIQDKGKYIEPKIVFDEIAGIHAVGKSNEDVQGFRFEHYDKIQYFPTNLENFLKNLTSISLHDLEIKEIHQSDLEPFGNLKYFYFGKNQLHTLEKDLFEFNPLLELLWLNNNKLSHIDPFVFSSLNSLRVLDLSFNSCKKSFSKVATKELVRTTMNN